LPFIMCLTSNTNSSLLKSVLILTGAWRITLAGSRSSLAFSMFVVSSFAPLLAKESIEFLDWEQ
jgi:hypothetical protein